MTTYEAYDRGLPCKNPNCKSQGKPHPNCHCYGQMAEGGEVSNYCDSGKMHHPGCEYSLEGMTSIDPSHDVAGYFANGGFVHHFKNDMSEFSSLSERGHKHIHNYCESLFGDKKAPERDPSKAKKAIHDWIEKGGVTDAIQEEIYRHHDANHYAHGGKVEKKEGLHDEDFAITHPDHNILLHTAKGRISNYLNSLKEDKFAPKLAFDDPPDQSEKKKAYEKALHIAAHPMSVVDGIRNGTIEPEHVRHLDGMYPELNDSIKKKMTEKITESQLKGEKPNYKIRQGMSLFMGTNLSSEMSPQNIQAAQASFQKQPQSQQNGGQGAPKKSTAKLSKSSQSFLTGNQSLVGRQQKQ